MPRVRAVKIPIGVGENLPSRDSKYLALVKERDEDAFRYPHDVEISQEAKKAVPLIMRLLENADDKSVAIIQVGLATNLAPLLEADGAMELIEAKVDHLSVMAGAFETIRGNNRYLEANVRNHNPTKTPLSSIQTYYYR